VCSVICPPASVAIRRGPPVDQEHQVRHEHGLAQVVQTAGESLEHLVRRDGVTAFARALAHPAQQQARLIQRQGIQHHLEAHRASLRDQGHT
jgi:hypothetical protein